MSYLNFLLDMHARACWIGAFNNKEIKELLKVPDEYEVVEATPLGYPSKDVFTDPRNRKNLDEIVSLNKF